MVKVDTELCDGCGVCIQECPNKVFKLVKNKAQAENQKDCMTCYLCETICRKLAIKVTQ